MLNSRGERSQLFKLNAEPGANYLVETDPAFTNYRNFLSSDYFEQQLAMDPERNLKRYGDGFTELHLVNDQILALTGRRFIGNYTDTEAEYMALMDAGVAFAKAYQLTPGVALSAVRDVSVLSAGNHETSGNELKAKAIQNLDAGNFTTNTVDLQG